MPIRTTATLGMLLLVSACLERDYTGPLAAEIRSDPSILVLGVGESRTVTVEAFVGNEPESVRWSIGNVGAGLTVAEDTSYGRTYVGGELVLPAQSHSRRFEVTMNDSAETSFVISGGTGIVTIPVRPPVP
jgi:hypothetical protein